ncbi:MAG: hypothetical protein AMXMBFR79_07730 [Chitinophagaceae bacterium]
MAGALTPVQALFNFKLAKAVNNTITSALISFLVGTLILLGYLLYKKQLRFDVVNVVKTEPYWIWLGGVIGAYYVVTLTYIVPKVGSSLAFSLVIAGQLIISLLVDHFGWFGVPVSPITIKKVMGIVALAMAIWLIKEN